MIQKLTKSQSFDARFSERCHERDAYEHFGNAAGYLHQETILRDEHGSNNHTQASPTRRDRVLGRGMYVGAVNISDGGSQREMYDLRYGDDGVYDTQNADVLLTEQHELLDALDRATSTKLRDDRSGPVTMLDFGFGSGRISVPLALSHKGETDLLVVAYDISPVGMKKAAERLAKEGFSVVEPFEWSLDAKSGYIVGDMQRRVPGGPNVTVRFVHASETDSTRAISNLLRSAIGGRYFDLTTSLFSPLCHIFGHLQRRAMFEALGNVTHPRGQVLFGGPTTGSHPEFQSDWWQRMQNNDVDNFPFDYPGDIVYETGEGFDNVLHPFGLDAVGHMQRTLTCPGQRIDVRSILSRGHDPQSKEGQVANAKDVAKFNNARREQPWSPEHFDNALGIVLVRDGIDVPDGSPLPPSPLAGATDPNAVASRLATHLHSSDRAPFWDYRRQQHQQVLVSTRDSTWIEKNDGRAFVDLTNTDFDRLPSDIRQDYFDDARFLIEAIAPAIESEPILHGTYLASVASDLQRHRAQRQSTASSTSMAVAELARVANESPEEVLLGRVNEAVFNLEADRYLRSPNMSLDQDGLATSSRMPADGLTIR